MFHHSKIKYLTLITKIVHSHSSISGSSVLKQIIGWLQVLLDNSEYI